MSHLSADVLWAQAQAPGAAAATHLAGCPACREALEDVRRAQRVLQQLPAPPPLPPAVAARVGAALAEAADRAAARRAPWWQGLLARPAVLVAAAAVAVLAAWGLAGVQEAPGPAPAPAPVARQAPAVEAAPRAEAPAPSPPGPAAPAPRRRSASVASARRAHVQEKPAAVAQLLEEGDHLRTDRGGSLWLQLPDGSRAGLTGSTAVTLRRLEAQALDLELSQGSLALVVPHRADRALTVHAGGVEVVDLGTRFSVSRSASRVLVAVEEGEVEVRAAGTVRRLGAGRALSEHDGQVATFPWAPVVERAALPPPAPSPFVPSQAARLSGEDEAAAAPPAEAADAPASAPSGQALVRPDEDWATLPASERPPAAPPPPAPVVTATPRPRRGFSLEELERRVHEFQQGLADAVFTPAAREAAMRQVVRRARAGECPGALVEADQWLAASPSSHPAEVEWRTEVLEARERCQRARRSP